MELKVILDENFVQEIFEFMVQTSYLHLIFVVLFLHICIYAYMYVYIVFFKGRMRIIQILLFPNYSCYCLYEPCLIL